MLRAKPVLILATLLAQPAARAITPVQPAQLPTAILHAAASAQSASNRPIIACFGDSLTAGAGIEPTQAYPAVLQQLLDREGYNYKVVNDGVSGDTTKDGLDRIDEVLRQHPAVVVVEFGGNDGLRGLSTAQAERNLSEIVSRIQASGAKVALAGITLPPQYGGAYIQSFDSIFAAVAARYHVPLLPFILQNVFGIPGDIQEDGIHPTAVGAQQVARNVEHLVVPLLHKSRV